MQKKWINKHNGLVRALMFRIFFYNCFTVAVFINIKENKYFLCSGRFLTHTLNRLCRGVLGWLGTLGLWPWETRGLRSPLVLLQQFSSPLGLSLHGSTVAFPVSTSISCVQAAAKSLMIQQLFSAWNKFYVNKILIWTYSSYHNDPFGVTVGLNWLKFVEILV